MAELKLYNTLTRAKETFTPLDASNVRMYVCGPTVYDFAHIGNARPVIVFDVLFRLLRHLYGPENVIYTRNITDVDDKINDRAARDFPDLPLNEAIRKVTEATAAQFQADVKALGCLEPTHQPRATEHIGQMIDIIGRLLANGYAYIAYGTEGREVLFSVEKMPRYGQLSNRKLEEQREGARVAVEAHKKSPGDFVLWKESSASEPGWSAEFVPDAEYRSNDEKVTIYGRPGWHIECSAMSMAKLLEPFGGGLACDDPAKNTFDIHGGGIDLVFPHHENEIAQSCCAFGKPGQPNARMANIWMHNGFLQVEGQKMSKSLGNFVTIADVLKDWPGEVARLAMLKTHYRQPIDWTLKSLEESYQTLARFNSHVEGVEVEHLHIDYDVTKPLLNNYVSGVIRRLCDDMNTPAVMAELSEMMSPGGGLTGGGPNSLAASLLLLGFDTVVGRRWPTSSTTVDGALVDSLIATRLAAREAKNFAESDRIRDELVAMGIQIMDSKDPITGALKTTWEVKR